MEQREKRHIEELLSAFRVTSPSPEVVARTKRLMREELLRPAIKPVAQEKWVFVLVGLTVAMSLCLFYMFTVGTILRFVLPVDFIEYLSRSQFALAAVGSCLVASVLMLLCFKQFSLERSQRRFSIQ